jgi:choline kinase
MEAFLGKLETPELIILAAGGSSRLLPVTDDIPKCLLRAGEKTLLKHIIDAFEMYGVTGFNIVVGYKYERILSSTSDEVKFIHNSEYSTTGSLFSLSLTKRAYGDGIVIANSDVYLVPELVEKILSLEASAALIDASAKWDAESTKVLVSGKRITRWSRELSEREWSGENIGVVKIEKRSVSMFYDIVEELLKQGNATTWWPEALNEFVRSNTIVPLYSNGLLCKEVDTVEDYEALINLIESGNSGSL